MGYGIKNGGGSAAVVNGILDEYYAHTEDISANTFVQFVDSYTSLSVASGVSKKGGATAVVLNNSKVLLLYYASNTIYGVIVTISGATMTLGTAQKLWSSAEDPYLSAVKLTETSVFVAFGMYARGGVVSINGTTLTAGATATVSGGDMNAGPGRCIARLSETKIVAFYPVGANGYYVYGCVATISGTTVTWGTNTLLWSGSGTSGAVERECILLPSGKVLVAFSGPNSDAGTLSLYAFVATISGTTVSAGTARMLHNENSTAYIIRMALLDDGRVAIAHGNGYIRVTIVSISGSTVTYVTRVTVDDYVSGESDKLRAFVGIGNNTFLLVYRTSTSSTTGILRVVTISGNTVSASSERTLSGINVAPTYFPLLVTMDDGSVIITHGAGTLYISHESVGSLTGMAVKKSASRIDGLTVGKLRPGVKGKLWKLG